MTVSLVSVSIAFISLASSFLLDGVRRRSTRTSSLRSSTGTDFVTKKIATINKAEDHAAPTSAQTSAKFLYRLVMVRYVFPFGEITMSPTNHSKSELETVSVTVRTCPVGDVIGDPKVGDGIGDPNGAIVVVVMGGIVAGDPTGGAGDPMGVDGIGAGAGAGAGAEAGDQRRRPIGDPDRKSGPK